MGAALSGERRFLSGWVLLLGGSDSKGLVIIKLWGPIQGVVY